MLQIMDAASEIDHLTDAGI